MQKLLISLPGQSYAPCKAGCHVIMLDWYKPGTHNIAPHLRVLAWPRSAISLQAAGNRQATGITHLSGCGDHAIASSHPQGHSLGLSQERSDPWAQANLTPAVQVELDALLNAGGRPGAQAILTARQPAKAASSRQVDAMRQCELSEDRLLVSERATPALSGALQHSSREGAGCPAPCAPDPRRPKLLLYRLERPQPQVWARRAG